MATGLIKRLVTEQGFGFINETGATEEIFFHSTSLSGGLFDRLSVGQAVEFDRGKVDTKSPRLRAINVRPAKVEG